MPDYRPATAFYRERRHSEAPRGMMPTSCRDGSGTILSGSMSCTRWTWKRYGNSSSFGRYGVPSSSEQPSLAGGNSLRGEEKKQTSRCNLRVKWMVGIAAFAAIAFIRRRLSGHATLELIRATLSQRRRRCQLPFEEPLHGLAEWRSTCAHGAERGGRAVVPWHSRSDCTCLRPRRSQREATPARCHSRVHSVWDRKKVRYKVYF